MNIADISCKVLVARHGEDSKHELNFGNSRTRTMKARDLVLRCYAEKIDHDVWQAFCLDLDLAVQGDSADEVSRKLMNVIDSWLEDALVGEDKEHAAELLDRRAPISWWIKYYYAVLLYKFGKLQDSVRVLFRHPLPLRINHGHGH